MAQRNSSGRTLTNLREFGGHVANAAKRALRNGAYTVAGDAKSRVPVRTGRLRDSIQVKGNSNGTYDDLRIGRGIALRFNRQRRE